MVCIAFSNIVKETGDPVTEIVIDTYSDHVPEFFSHLPNMNLEIKYLKALPLQAILVAQLQIFR